MTRGKRRISLKCRFFRRFFLILLLIAILAAVDPTFTARSALDRALNKVQFPPCTILQEGDGAGLLNWVDPPPQERWYTFSGGGYAGFSLVYQSQFGWNCARLLTLSLDKTPMNIAYSSSGLMFLIYCDQPAASVAAWYEEEPYHWTSLSLGDGLFLLYPDFTRTDVAPAVFGFGPGIRVAALDAEGQTVCELVLGDDYSRYMMF